MHIQPRVQMVRQRHRVTIPLPLACPAHVPCACWLRACIARWRPHLAQLIISLSSAPVLVHDAQHQTAGAVVGHGHQQDAFVGAPWRPKMSHRPRAVDGLQVGQGWPARCVRAADIGGAVLWRRCCRRPRMQLGRSAGQADCQAQALTGVFSIVPHTVSLSRASVGQRGRSVTKQGRQRPTERAG